MREQQSNGAGGGGKVGRNKYEKSERERKRKIERRDLSKKCKYLYTKKSTMLSFSVY